MELHRSGSMPEIEPLEGYKLLPGESIIKVEHHPDRSSQRVKLPSSLEQMMRLTNVALASEIGRYGPTKAAIAFDDSAPEYLQLYTTLFGRDSLRVAIDLINSYPDLARTTTLELARQQGISFNTAREEEPGRIVHEVRSAQDPIAQELTEERGWDWPYYGSVDATSEFIITLAAYCQLSEENAAFLAENYIDRSGQVRTMSQALEMALQWIKNRLDSSDIDLLEYKTTLPLGIENQVWKDSWDAYHHADGEIANHNKPIASIEVQVSTYNALLSAADLYEEVLDQQHTAKPLRERADQLKEKILTMFWVEDEDGYFALGIDRDEKGQPRQMQIKTSNMGHVLNSHLLMGNDPKIMHMREQTINHIFSPRMLAASGIRTLASDEIRFRPGAYHNGSVWLWDTHHIAKGLRNLGQSENRPDYIDKANDLDRRIVHAVNQTRMFPEYVRGDDKDLPSTNQSTIVLWDSVYQRENQIEQPPQEVQAWTVAAILDTKRRHGLDYL